MRKDMFERPRDPVSGLTHFVPAVAALFGTIWLLYMARGDLSRQMSLLVYGMTLVLMFAASAAYHSIKDGPPAIEFLRKLDHSAIYFLIAGTYTPICLNCFSGFFKWGLLSIVWISAIIGVGIKVFIIHAPRWITAGIYLVMGWLSLLAIQAILTVFPVGAIVWLVLGGLFFTLGAVIYIRKKPDWYPGVFGFHELWHIFVILGCASHFILVAAYVAA